MKKIGLIPALLLSLLACNEQSETVFDAAAYRAEVVDWRAGRLDRLMDPMGYLTQTGLFWLQPGTYRFGAQADNDIVFAGDAAPVIGEFVVDEEGVTMQVATGVDVRSDEQPVTSLKMQDDTMPAPTLVTHRSLAWSVVKRDGRFAVRLRDFENPFVETFGPLPYFEIDPTLRVTAVLQPYDEPRVVNVGTVIEGLGYHPTSPGTVAFEVAGAQYDLEAYESGERLFFVFGDATNRDDTYGAGRFLYADAPDENGETILDFNLAYSPPCAFNDFSTCPVASPRNRLPIRIEAGEKYDEALYYATAAK
jgi:uncharacterized protein (DUF1684 family)